MGRFLKQSSSIFNEVYSLVKYKESGSDLFQLPIPSYSTTAIVYTHSRQGRNTNPFFYFSVMASLNPLIW
jgi:hypothetical protein